MGRRDADVDQEELERLSGLIEAQQENLGVSPKDKQSRRGMLKLAGAAIVGAAGGAALSAMPASAAQGGNMLIGVGNDGTGETGININGTTGPLAVLNVTNGDTSGSTMDGVDTQGLNGGHGLFATSDSGVGVLAASNTGPDVQLGFQGKFSVIGSGRLSMLGRTDTNTVAPTTTPTSGWFETVRGSDGSLWVSRASGSGQTAWRRMNSVRVDSAANDGTPFVPVRVINTDAGIGPVVGGVTGPLHQGNTYNFTIAGTNGIPADALGIVGNITAVAYTSGGFLTMFPQGASRPVVSSVNFAGTFFAWGNHFTVGFGTGGAISIFIGLNTAPDTCHVIVDVFGYIQ
jgi:hypothetical protein